MLLVRIAVAVSLSITVPFGIIWAIDPLSHIVMVDAAIHQFPRLSETMGLLAYPLSAAVGFSFILRIKPYKTLETPERQLIIGAAIIYFPVMCASMLYWTVSIGGGI